MYKFTEIQEIVRVEDSALIPKDEENRDYQEYLEWVNQGNTPDPYTPPAPEVPLIVSRFQARAALHQAGLLDQVETLMSDPATEFITKLAWTDAQEFHRNSPTVRAMAQPLGLDDAALDQLFLTAAGIVA